MALVTRCSNPDCLTLFRVTPAQLQAFGGQVRCGSCNTVFDAFPSLTTVADSALKAPEAAPGQAAAVPVTEPAAPVKEPAAPVTELSAPVTESAAAFAQAGAPAASGASVNADAVSPGRPATDEPTASDAPETGQIAADGRRAADFGAGETVSEWTGEAAQPAVDARSPPVPMAVEQVPDLPPVASPDVVDASASASASASAPLPDAPPLHDTPPATTVQAVPAAPAVGRAAAAQDIDPVPRAAPELTDYSVTPGPPRQVPPPASRARIVLVFGGLLLVAAAGIVLFAGDRLPAPLARLFAPAALATLLREQAPVVAVALVAVLCWVLRRYRATWIVAAAALLLLLGGQLVVAYRTQIATFYPASRPLLEQLCRAARCEVGLPKAADQLVIESSDLQAVDAAKPNLIQLAASVRNRAAIEVAFPAIEVTLTDAQDRPLARRVLLPEQYLAGRQPARAGLRAGEDFSIRLTLDTTELRPVGYRLYLFYP